MITRIEALNYRCLRYVAQDLGPFHVLVGPNASGKTTFLDVVAFMGQVVSGGLEAALANRTPNFQDLLWRRSGEAFELALEAAIPEALRETLRDPECDVVRYEIALGMDNEAQKIAFRGEKVLLKRSSTMAQEPQAVLKFPKVAFAPPSLLTPTPLRKGAQLVINKVPGGNDNFYSETYSKKGKGWVPAFKLGPQRSALGNLPEDESKFPVATWLKALLATGVQQLILNSLLIRKASPPGKGRALLPDGSNLPWAIAELRERNPDRFRDWIDHLRTALPDLEDVRIVDREDDRHSYLVLRYRGGLDVPSWMASDGTLRLLALTLLAYLPDFSGIYLIEEPENGIHPRAVETMFQSLSSVYDAQILLATHSPVVLSCVEPQTLLCFAKTDTGETDIILGSEHPALKHWQGEVNMSTLFAAGVLG